MLPTHAQEKPTESAHPKFLGAQSCSSSSCHGGAGENRQQYTIWSKLDFHSRSYTTLTTARSARIAEALKIGDPTRDARCTVCHAPFQTVPATQLAKDVDIEEGVSCGSCHGPAENWLRSHTRTDFSHQDRVNAGMRDLKNLCVRANTCVACHQNVDADLLQAGHPELIFELDGQSVSEPKHWRESTNWNGAQAWLVGQQVALREMSWQLAREKSPTENQINRWKGLVWLFNHMNNPKGGIIPSAIGDAKSVQQATDAGAKYLFDVLRDKGIPVFLSSLASTSSEFRDSSISQPLQARRAERLVLALDRLVTALPELDKNEPVQSALKRLFKDAQSLPDFNPAQFAEHLGDFHQGLLAPPQEGNKPKAENRK
ncbi:MAG: hypothetical protein HY298_09660 [Verrucomicrobia bacterium]|nr:hypothetical protein [Verrucomicrobiota bacterium]